MDFESPDVEKDFPGLYASESNRKSNESDFSDDVHEKPSKKDLLIGKRKDKKDLRYATLEGESSVEEDADIKSPLKSKKSKAFKFSSKKEKDKDKDKDVLEKEKKKDSKKEKEKKKEVKSKEVKDKKKKNVESVSEIADELPIFGVNLEYAVKRNPCHDGIDVPLLFRQCLERIEDGITTEGLYKTATIKSSLHRTKRMINERVPINLSSYDVFLATNLLKSFIKELPEPIFLAELLNTHKLNENSAKTLIDSLSYYNKQFVTWLIIHLEHVVAQEKLNKMSLQTLSSIFSPLLQVDQPILSFLISNSSKLFPDFKLIKYIPPLSSSSTILPETSQDIMKELKKQESLLGLIHWEMNAGYVSKSREEQLWEVQRMITQLKRKLRLLEKETQPQLSVDAPVAKEDEFSLNLNLQKSTEAELEVKTVIEPAKQIVENAEKSETDHPTETVVSNVTQDSSGQIDNTVNSALELEKPIEDTQSQESKEDEEFLKTLLFETEELNGAISDLQSMIFAERKEIEKMRDLLSKAGLSTDVNLSISFSENDNSEQSIKLQKESLFLESQEMNLVNNIIKEREAIIDLRVQIRMLELEQSNR